MKRFLALAAAVVEVIQAAVIEDGRYANDAAAQAVWVPMATTAPVSAATVEGQQVLRFPCNFNGTALERASWDRRVTLDLTAARGVELKLWCGDPSPVAYFSLYFQSGDGWYHASFYPELTNGWNVIPIDKSGTTIEGNPAGWGRITTLRLSAWRGESVDTQFFLGEIREAGVLGTDALVAILRSEAAAQRMPDEARSIAQYTEAMARAFLELDLACTVVSDLDVTAERLRQARLVVLPHNPGLPDRAADELVRYVERGGKLLAFYTLPERLRKLLHVGGGAHVRESRPGQFAAIRFADPAVAGAPPIVKQRSWNLSSATALPGASRVLAEWLDDQGQPTGQAAVVGSTNGLVMTHVLLPDDGANKHRMLLALAGYLAPDLWKEAVDAGIARVGTLAGFNDFDQAVAQIGVMGKDQPAVGQTLAQARTSLESARSLAAARQYADALDAATTAGQKLERAFCLAQRAVPGEFRAFWCHSAFGVEGMDWDEAIRRLAENGFTAILPNMLWGGAAFYESQTLPVAAQVALQGDQIARCLTACRKYGVQVHVWKVNWNLGHAAPEAFIDRMRRDGRLQADAQGKIESWLCPSHPDNQKLEIASMVEVARRYEVDGVHFDYIRFPDGAHCFCAGCRERFERATGAALAHWPKDVLAGGPQRQRWLDWRRDQITQVVKAVSEQARAFRPKLKISAAVFPRWNTDRDSVGQDWKLWCDRGYLDFVCPMDYTASNRNFENLVAQQVQWAGRVPCYPGIGVSASASKFGVDRAIAQIEIARRHRTGGFVIFNYGVLESRDLLPLLGLGITRRD